MAVHTNTLNNRAPDKAYKTNNKKEAFYMLKKSLALILSVISVLFAFPAESLAASVNREEVYRVETVYNADGSYDDIVLDKKDRVVELEELEESYVPEASDSVCPESWDSRDKGWVTSVKNQNPYGTCWAFATCAAAESSLIAQGYETADSIDLSEAHLARFVDAYEEGSSNPVCQERYILPEGKFNSGGSFYQSAAAVTRWSGFTTEEKYPYSKTEENMNFSSDAMFEHDYGLASARVLKSNDEVKMSIMKNGAVGASFYYNSYAQKGCTYYQWDRESTNHAITVIGWDDNYSASNFWTAPEGDGAWLCKNSWDKNWGLNGFFWISYYDTSFSNCVEFVAEPAEYDNNYQYNGLYTLGALQMPGKIFTANVFTAEDNECIRAAGFNTWDNASYECTVSVYTDLSDPGKPASGTLRQSKTVCVSNKGYYSVEFDCGCEVTRGEKFSVVVEYRNTEGGKAYAPVEHFDSAGTVYTVAKGQSFAGANLGSMNDVTSMYSYIGNLSIKAFSDKLGKRESISIASLPKTEYYTGEKLDLSGLSVNAVCEGAEPFCVDYSVVSVPDMSTPGRKTVEVEYRNLKAKFSVYVMDADAVMAQSTAVINSSARTVAGLQSGLNSLDGFVSLKSGYTCECSSYGTGGKVSVYMDGVYIGSYSLIIYGDLNGDSWYDGKDAEILSAILSGQTTADSLVREAADCNHDGCVDDADYAILSRAERLRAEYIRNPETGANEYYGLISQTGKAEHLSFFQRLVKFFTSIFSFLKFWK